IVYAGYGLAENGLTSNECLEIESPVSLDFAATGESWISNSVIACTEATKGTLANGDTLRQWVLDTSANGANYDLNAGNVIVTESATVSVLEPGSFYTAESLLDENGVAFTMTPAGGRLGAVTSGEDWTSPWAFGLRASNADEPLWFAQ